MKKIGITIILIIILSLFAYMSDIDPSNEEDSPITIDEFNRIDEDCEPEEEYTINANQTGFYIYRYTIDILELDKGMCIQFTLNSTITIDLIIDSLSVYLYEGNLTQVFVPSKIGNHRYSSTYIDVEGVILVEE
ncbi:MAG: hypothetical protein V3V41_07855 [Candidatus Heimdallarchaeota archaeon]